MGRGKGLDWLGLGGIVEEPTKKVGGGLNRTVGRWYGCREKSMMRL